MGRFVAAVGIVLFVVFGSQPDFSQGAPSDEAARKAELAAAWQTAGIGGTAGSADIPQIYRATLKSPTGDDIFRSVLGTRQKDRRPAVISFIEKG